MIKTGGEVTKGLIKSGGDIADKLLTKSGDFATSMLQLTSKLSDDIGVMADRILTMADKIGEMADRIERTEVLTAKLTAALADRDLDLSAPDPSTRDPIQYVVLDIDACEISGHEMPTLSITGNPEQYLLYVSINPLFQEGSTVVSHVDDVRDFRSAWKRSVEAVAALKTTAEKVNNGNLIVSVAVKTKSKEGQLSALSNSVDIRVGISDTQSN